MVRVVNQSVGVFLTVASRLLQYQMFVLEAFYEIIYTTKDNNQLMHPQDVLEIFSKLISGSSDEEMWQPLDET